jgi:hypothetical protein
MSSLMALRKSLTINRASRRIEVCPYYFLNLTILIVGDLLTSTTVHLSFDSTVIRTLLTALNCPLIEFACIKIDKALTLRNCMILLFLVQALKLTIFPHRD